VYVLKLLQSILNANKTVLEGIKTEKDWPRLTNIKKGDSLAELIRNTKETELSWSAFTALWMELMLPGRPPVLFALDGLSHINKISEYRDPTFKPVHAHDLVLVGTFVDVLSGRKPLPNGGAAIAATSGNNFTRPLSQELALSQIEAGQTGGEIPQPDPYQRGYDERVYDAVKNTQVIRLEGVKQDDAWALMGYWGASGMMRSVVNSQTVKEKWALSGHGIVGEMERTALMTLRM
jgi:small subunit ribosomal protein S29